MEVRCGSCKKLFRVSDDKITGPGVKFKCTRCSEYVRITKEDFEQYNTLKAAAAALQAPGAKPVEVSPVPEPPRTAAEGSAPLDLMGFEHHKPAAAEVSPGVSPASEPKPPLQPAPEVAPEPVPASALSVTTQSRPAAPPPPPREQTRPSTLSTAAKPAGVQKPKQAIQDTIHPFVSGASAGAIGGFGCALPVLTVMLLAFGIISKILPALSKIPIVYAVIVSAAGLMALGIVIGVFLAMIQSGTERKLFSFPGMLLGALLGAVIGAGYAVTADMASGAGIATAHILNSAANSGITAFLVGIAVVIIRRNVLSSRKESFSTRLSGLQVFGLILSLTLVGFSVYGTVMLRSKMRAAAEETVSEIFKDMTSTEGLQTTNTLSGYIDTNGDLVIAGVVENISDKEKPWYLVADVYDAQNSVLTKAKMLNGKQLYTKRDYEIMAKRGVNVQDVKARELQDKGALIPPKGTVNFEIRVMEPPIGIATFNATLQKFDPLQMMKEVAEDMKQGQQ